MTNPPLNMQKSATGSLGGLPCPEHADGAPRATRENELSETRRPEDIAAENERRFSNTMIESMPGIVYFYDDQGRFLRWNRNFEIVSGYSGDEIARMHPLDFFSAEERDLLTQRISAVFEKGESFVEASFRAKDGTTKPYFFTGRRVIFDGKPCLVGMGMDISERKRAEGELRTSLARFHAAAQATNDVIWDWNLETGSIWWNESFQTSFGYGPQDIEPGIESWINRIHPDDRKRVETGIHAVLDSRQDTWTDEYRFRRRDGSYAEVFDRGHVLRNEAGRAVRMVGAIQDITERKKIELARQTLNEQLEKEVADRTEELRTALIRAEAADRTKSAFLATMSHELRTPLNSIIGFTGIVLQGLAGPLNPEQTKQLGMVRNSARHLLDLINDVLDISKIEAGQLEVRAEPFALRDSLLQVAALVKPMVEKKGLTLTLNISSDLGEMVSDKRRVEQILLNLASNAIKFTDRGAVTLTAEKVTDSCGRPEAPSVPAVRLRVDDTGIGLKPEDLEGLFQPFRQVDSGLNRRHEGTGLGLVICRRLANLLGGEIFVTSAWEKGSSFTVTLPLQPPSLS
jgi:PAS domain S-box-containing protein